jgi:hypothetical protein
MRSSPKGRRGLGGDGGGFFLRSSGGELGLRSNVHVDTGAGRTRIRPNHIIYPSACSVDDASWLKADKEGNAFSVAAIAKVAEE